MSKQSEAKRNQGYVEKPELKQCNTCHYFTCVEEEHKDWSGEVYTLRKSIKCSFGNFAVKNKSICNEYIPK